MFIHFYSYGEGIVTGRKTSQLTADRGKGNKYIIAESLSPEKLKKKAKKWQELHEDSYFLYLNQQKLGK